MAASPTELFTRDEALAGLPARRAQAALFLIESRTGRLVAEARQALEPFLGEATVGERDLAFVEAFSLGKAPPLRPTIQDLERYSAAWRNLAPENPRGRAALARLLGHKYRFTAAAVPSIRAALGFDEPAVQAAYEKLYDQPLASIYAVRPNPLDRLRWAWAGLGLWFDNLSPFWTVFILTFIQTMGATILVLPIALAGVGPIPGIMLLAIFGLVNMLTIAAQAEAAARSGEMRYGGAFLSRMVERYLGPMGAGIVAVAIAADCIITLLAFYAGFGNSMADATGLPDGLWAAGLFLIILYFLRRESLSATVTSSLVIGGVNMCLLAIIAGLAFAHSQPENLSFTNLPLLETGSFDIGILQVIFGIVLGAYFGHLTVGNCAQLVLHRDPSARSLIWGAAAALGVAIIVYSIWVLAVNGAVPFSELAGETGTALGPLAAAVGPAVDVLGAIYVILAIAIVSVHFSLSLYNLMRERLPRHTEPVVWLPRRHGRLILRPRWGGARSVASLTYLGLTTPGRTSLARFRVDMEQGESHQSVELRQAGCWDETALRKVWPQLDRRMRMAVTVEAATLEGVRLQVSTPMTVRYEGDWDAVGLHMTDVLDLVPDVRHLLMWLMRRGEVTAAEATAYLNQDAAATRLMLRELVQQGILLERPGMASGADGSSSEPRYRPQLGRRRGNSLPAGLWQALDSKTPGERAETALGQGNSGPVSEAALLARIGPRGRFWLAASPIGAIFLVTEVLLWTGNASFVGILGFLGTVVDSLLAGVFPVLLLYASRRKGEFVPAKVYRLLGQRWLLGGVYALFIGGILLHGLVIWQEPMQRLSAVLVSLFMLVATAILTGKGVFHGRVVVEVCEDVAPGPTGKRGCEGKGRLAVTALGRPAEVAARLTYGTNERTSMGSSGDLPEFAALRQVTVDLPAMEARDLKLWTHRVTPEGLSEGMPAVAEVRCGGAATFVDLGSTHGEALLPWPGPASQVTLRFEDLQE